MLIPDVDTENFDPRASHFPVFSPDGKMIAIKQGKQTVGIWNTSTGEHLNTLTGHESTLSLPVFSPDSKTIVTKTFVRFDKGGTVRLWDVATGENIMTFSYPDYYPQFVFSPDGKMLATNYSDNSVRLWDTTTGENIKTLTGHTDVVHTPIFSRDGRILATHSKNWTVRLWEVAAGKNIKTFNAPGGTSIKISHSPENDLLVISANSWEKTATIWNVNTAERLVTFSKHSGGFFKSISQTFSKWLQPRKFRHRRIASIRAIKYSPSGDTLMVVMDNEMLRLWNVRTTKPIGKPIDPVKDDKKGSFVGAIYSPDGKTFATVPASHAGNVRLWDAATGKYLITLRGHTNADGYAVTFSPDSRKFATGHMDGTVILWNIPTR
ncbi:MAG: WD40 repeat domain-containing protein [Candidatus Poribacteria bacterium]|nr:WD40 repeat domain-containing protein [Candidatus Poribacteria bacterium]